MQFPADPGGVGLPGVVDGLDAPEPGADIDAKKPECQPAGVIYYRPLFRCELPGDFC